MESDLIDVYPQPAEFATGSGDLPRVFSPGRSGSDRVFRGTVRSIAVVVLIIFGSIGVFLGYQSIPTFRHYGLKFLTSSAFQPELNKIGIAGTLVGTFEVAFVALAIAFPLALCTAIFISEIAPIRFRGLLVALIDLMAAVPSVIYGAWGFLLLMPHAKYVSRWMNQYLGWIPIFRVNANPNAAAWAESRYVGSAFIAGICVSLMVMPIACAVMRGVFAQAPLGEREAAYALGSTRWGMVRTVVLPFGRGGIIGGVMLGLGRALGETVAVLLIVSFAFGINFRILQSGTTTISSLIANSFGDATGSQLAALLTAGFVLFLITLAVNTVAAVFVSRSRSGAATDI
jgi:phosphate transport system permease protein